MSCDPERQQIINDAARILNDIDQGFLDAAYWNRIHPQQAPVSFDPDGKMQRIRVALKATLKREAQLGNRPTVIPLTAHERRYIPMEVSETQARQIARDLLLPN